MSKYNIYCRDISGDQSLFELCCEKDGLIVARQFENSFEDILISCGDFFTRVCETHWPDTKLDTLEVHLNHVF